MYAYNDSKYSPNIAHILQNFQQLLFNELLLQNIPGKVTQGCSQQFTSTKT